MASPGLAQPQIGFGLPRWSTMLSLNIGLTNGRAGGPAAAAVNPVTKAKAQRQARLRDMVCLGLFRAKPDGFWLNMASEIIVFGPHVASPAMDHGCNDPPISKRPANSEHRCARHHVDARPDRRRSARY